jgi:hypothetical protein
LLVTGAQLVACEDAERRLPAVGLASHEAKHPRLERYAVAPGRSFVYG